MSVDVKYKGATIATVEAQETKTLTTAGKYCEGDIVLTDDSNPVAEDNDVIFIDYDGTIRYSYTADEFLALTELPPNPHHAGLVAQGWNWTLEDAQEYVDKYDGQVIGQLYITDDGKTHAIISIPKYADKSVGFLFTKVGAGDLIIDFGDGTTETYSGSGEKNITHEFPIDNAEYDVSVYVTAGSYIIGAEYYLAPNFITKPYLSSLQIGINASIGRDSLPSQSEAFTISIPNLPFSWIGTSVCSAICLIFPNGSQIPPYSGGIGNASLYQIRKVSISKNVPNLYAYFMQGAIVDKAYFPSILQLGASAGTSFNAKVVCLSTFGPSTIYSYTAGYGVRWEKFTVPDNVTGFATYGLRATITTELRFFQVTPPTAPASTSLSGVQSGCRIYVPFEGLAAYVTATNYPGPTTRPYFGFAKFADGALLPTQEPTGVYNVTWYESKDNAANAFNPITVGNGKKLYCTYSVADLEVSE